MQLTLLGSGSVRSAPVWGCNCIACQQARVFVSRQRRSACCMIEADGFKLLIDAGLLNMQEIFQPGDLSHILLTHYHMDHVQGLFELRWGENQNITVIGPDDPDGCADLFKHPGIFDFSNKAQAFVGFDLGPFHITPLPLIHSKPTLGYLVEKGDNRIAYLCDTVGLSKEVTEYLHSKWIDAVIVDCSAPPQDTPPTHHNDLTMALDIHASVRCDQTILTHIDHELDVWLQDNIDNLPNNVNVGHDGLTISL